MARTTQGTLDLDLESLTDEDLRELSVRVRQALQTRVLNRLEVYKHLAREAGLTRTIGRIREADALLRRGRPSFSAERQEGERRPVAAKYRNPANPWKTGRGGDTRQNRSLKKSLWVSPGRIFSLRKTPQA